MTNIHDIKHQMDEEVREEQDETLLGYEDRKTGQFKTVDLTKFSTKELQLKAKFAAIEQENRELRELNDHSMKQWQKWQAKALGYLTNLRKYEPDAK